MYTWLPTGADGRGDVPFIFGIYFWMGVFALCSDAKDLLIQNMTANLPVLRKKLKLSQQALAEFIGSSRYTVMLMETGKRKMTWNTFLSLILLFDKNEETAVLLRALQIYTDDLNDMIIRQPESGR